MRLALILLPLAAFAQQFTWEGDVSGIITVRVRGNKATIEPSDGPPPANVKFRFESKLPETRQPVRLTVRESRGIVRLAAQPSLENDYSAAVTIEDRQDGASHYAFTLDWDAPAASGRQRRDQLKWTGTLDGVATVACRNDVCASEAERGGPVTGERTRFSRPLPALARQLSIDATTGSADFRILEHPSADNGYTARIQVRALTRATPCSFTASWERPALLR